MANFSESITFSKNNLENNQNITKKIDYKCSITLDKQVYSTSYNNSINNNILNENFNKLYKNGDKIYEKIGNSQNKNSWNVKEFLNTNLEKEYKESYINNDFKDILVNAVYNIDNNDLITNEFKKDITTKLLK
jgi:hypothetical protein